MADAFKTAANLRKSLRGELEAISDYEMFAHETEYAEIRALFHDTANDERMHVAEYFQALLRVDPDQAKAFQKVFGGA